jgi:hypothetical protein
VRRSGGIPRSAVALRRGIAIACLIWLSLSAAALASGCGPTLFTFNILPASSAVHQAAAAGAAEWAPYEYWSAHEYLEKAAEEANEGNYQDAIRFAERAKELGEQARDLTSERARAAATAGGPE